MPDPIIQQWKQRGHVYLWKYKGRDKNFPGLHCSADRDGCQSLLELFALFPQAMFPVTAIITLTRPSEKVLSVPRRDQVRVRTFQTLKIKYAQPGYADELWELTVTDSQAVLHLGVKRLAELKQGIRNMSMGKNDYNIGTSTTEDAQKSYDLWFW